MPDLNRNRAMVRELVLADLPQELESTRRMLEGLPEDRWAWRPHEKSWSLGELATHVVNLLNWQMGILREGGFDVAARPPPRDAAAGPEALLEEFDERAARLQAELDGLDDEALRVAWTLRRGDTVMLELPRAVALRKMGISHMVHHRGQLAVYRRLLDLRVPGMYGPSADEEAAAAAG